MNARLHDAMTPAPIADRLQRVARRHVERHMPADPSGEVAAMDFANLLVVYGTWRGRFVKAHPRTVHVSRELTNELPGSLHESVIDAIRADFAAGADITPRLSTDVLVAHVPARGRGKAGRSGTRNLDAMLAHDGLHHLHLGTGGGRFVSRTETLLFVAVRPDDVYLIGVYPHGAWGRADILRRMIRNWPESGLAHRSRTVVGVEREYTDEERWSLMKGGINVGPLEVDGGFYALATGGQTIAGGPMAVSRRVMELQWQLTCLRTRGVRQYLLELGIDPDQYWVPTVDEHDALGLVSDAGFCRIGHLS